MLYIRIEDKYIKGYFGMVKSYLFSYLYDNQTNAIIIILYPAKDVIIFLNGTEMRRL